MPIVRAHGPLAARTWQLVLADLRDLIEEGHPRMGLDLSRVTWMGRWQAEVLLEARERLVLNGRVLSLISLSPAAITALSRAATRKSSTG